MKGGVKENQKIINRKEEKKWNEGKWQRKGVINERLMNDKLQHCVNIFSATFQ